MMKSGIQSLGSIYRNAGRNGRRKTGSGAVIMAREDVIQQMAEHIEDFGQVDCNNECPVHEFCEARQNRPNIDDFYTCTEILKMAFDHANNLGRMATRKNILA